MRRKKVLRTTAEPKSRAELEAQFGAVWDTKQLAGEFVVTAIIPNTLVVRRKADNVVGTLEYQDRPRLYYNFRPQQAEE